jgi:uncharacterized protein YjgD (DUF1641 family)
MSTFDEEMMDPEFRKLFINELRAEILADLTVLAITLSEIDDERADFYNRLIYAIKKKEKKYDS